MGENLIFNKPLRKQAWSFTFLVAIIMLALAKLAKRLKGGEKPKNKFDRIAMDHNIAYSKAKNLQDKWKADDVMIKAIDRLPGKKTMTEKVVKKTMQAKKKLKL